MVYSNDYDSSSSLLKINVREHRRGNTKMTIQKNWQHWIHIKQDEDKQTPTHTYVRK